MEKKDRRLAIGKALLESGQMSSFAQLMTVLTVTVIREALGKGNHRTMLNKVFNPEKFTVEDIINLAGAIECDPALLFHLAEKEFLENRDKTSKE